jgi:hypothetical protein
MLYFNIMNRFLLSCILFSSVSFAIAQTPDDAIRNSYQIQQGTARNMAVGGAMGSLGGDISAANVNPAGLGFYKTGELVLSAGFNMRNNNFDFRGTGQKTTKNGLGYGASGLVFGWGSLYNKGNSTAFSISVNQSANFNNHTEYTGLNNVSSFSEQYVEELVNNRADVNSAENNFVFGSSLAFNTYLVDTFTAANGDKGFKSYVPLGSAGGVIQHNIIDTKGGINEIAIAVASNHNDKLYIGGSLGIPIYSYTKHQVYSEDDATNNANNNFAYFDYTEDYTSTGAGINAKIGVIYKPAPRLRLGFAFHTPTFYTMEDKITSAITANTENFHGVQTSTSNELHSNTPGDYKYTMTTPLKMMISGSYVFNEVKDVRKQKAFLTADLEYVPHQSTRYDITDGGTQDDKTYYNNLNDVISQRYKSVLNARVGGEVKFTTIYARGGFAYYGNPYKDASLKNDRMLLSGGLGYRNHGIFIDLTYVYTMKKDTNIPYYLEDKANTFAVGKNNVGNIMATFGVKF